MPQQSPPLVSVVLPVYNAERYLRTSIKSILIQSYRNLEVVAIDDGSRDASPQILAEMQRHDRRIHLITRANRGIVATLNEGIRLARGPLVARMDADDIAYPGRIAAQVDAFVRNPRLAICGSHYDLILSPTRGLRFSEDKLADDQFAARSVFHSVLAHPTVMLNRAVLGSELRYDPAYEFAEDFELFSRVGRTHPVRRLQDRLLAYRMHGGSTTSLRSRAMRGAALRVVAENLAHFGLPIGQSAVPAALKAVRDSRDTGPLLQLLSRIAAHAATLDSHLRTPFERSFAHFVHEIVFDVCATSGRLAASICDAGGFWPTLRKRERYYLRTSRLLPRAAWTGFRAVSRGLDAVRSISLERLVPQYRELTGATLTLHM
jgi:glycosyltransferase involved in cell wall biosynthesis